MNPEDFPAAEDTEKNTAPHWKPEYT